jgi:pyruvate,water dikinase
MEWTLATAFTVLQARPVTRPDRDKKRSWYLTLKPGGKELAGLRRRVTEQIIPALEKEGAAMAAEDLKGQDRTALARTLKSRIARLAHWRRVYEQELIPFAHGVRRFGAHYAVVVKPPDPFEFVRILAGTDMLAARRNRMLERLAARLRKSPRLAAAVKRRGLDADRELAKAARRLLEQSFDVEFAGERLSAREDILVANLLALAARPPHRRPRTNGRRLERRYLTLAADEGEAREILETARLSWRLRDDDNLLVGRLESQLLRAAEEAAARLRCRVPEPDQFAELAAALAQGRRPRITAARAARVVGPKLAGKARQLVGQPAAPGLAQGRARIVATAADLKVFQPGEVLVCDAIQPNMTHLVPLAAAIVERRGGMLIHGAIIARELGIPCVNGVPDAGRAVASGEELTVDGHLGIVSVGRPELDFELGRT